MRDRARSVSGVERGASAIYSIYVAGVALLHVEEGTSRENRPGQKQN